MANFESKSDCRSGSVIFFSFLRGSKCYAAGLEETVSYGEITH